MKITSYQPFFGISPKQLNDEDFNRLTTYFQLLDSVEKPVVSLVTPVYRAKETLVGHICSLANLKTIIPYEVIFVENNADTESLSILQQLGAKVVSQPEQGITHARQKGLEVARGQIICSMDPDTIYDPYYIDHMVLPFFEEEDLVLTYSVSKSYDADFQLSRKMKLRNKLKEMYFRMKMAKGFTSRIKHIRAVCMAIKKDALLPIGYETDLRAVSGCDDGMLAMHLHTKGIFQYVPVDVYTALPPKREPGKPFPFCNERFINTNTPLEDTYHSLEIEKIGQ
ncbi:glycosyltransferase family 2 protein [Flagellimonas allohymeniacidonis]|uniref:Glycosyltransferase family 2 protein n=1 Tax=Flagellimonas allohymeniacidonis TaxID=2517819 RepID=A0A4V2HSC0_9FLAO|nr:glycosyltransferase family A protein [Allomuricauda hymeniacidonis]TAI47160.1 glycosyltransferase family 2 protein [Allomuricauda hymeniacidonis]